MPSIRSVTKQKERVCEPSPNTVSGSLRNAWEMKAGTTRPSRMRMRIRDGRVVPAFISQALRNEPLTVFGDGSQTRSFCFVTDLIEGIYRLLMSDEVNPTNIGNPNEMTVLQFAQEIKRLTGSNAPIEFRPLPEDDPKIRRPDITKARALLKWEPVVLLEEGLQKTIDYFRRV